MPESDGLNLHSFPRQTPEAVQINSTSNGFVATLDPQNVVMTMEGNSLQKNFKNFASAMTSNRNQPW
jgi:hypothetical protein